MRHAPIRKVRFPRALLLVLAGLWSCGASAEPPARRSELSVHDVGEYAAVPWQKPGLPITPGSRADRVRDLNLSVASINLRDDLPAEYLQRWREQPQPGKVLLPRVYFWDGKDRFQGPLRDIEVYWRRLDRFLAAMNLAEFQGIVLAEENISYSGRPEVLTELYRRIKAKYEIPVWQWWSPSTSLPESGGWIPADGWIIDPYFMPNPAFRRFVRKYLVTGLPLVIMPWASAHEKSPPLTAQQWKANNEQLGVAVEFNLPAAFYWTYGKGSAGSSCMFGCSRGEITTEWDKINHWVWDYHRRVQTLPADYTGLSSADEAVGDILEIGPNRERKLVYADDFSTAKCVDDASMSGFRDLIVDGKTLSARGFRNRRVDATLVYHFAGDFAAQYPSTALTVLPGSSNDRRAELALSTDGKTWSHQAASAGVGRQRLACVTRDDPHFASLRSFWVRIGLSGPPGSREKPSLSVDDLQIETTVAAADNSTVTLKPVPEMPGRLFYEDNFCTEKYLFATRRTGDDHLEWSHGQIAVRLRPGGSKPELIWQVKTGAGVRDLSVEVTGRANNGSLGTNHYLDVSRDGKTWVHEVNTVGRPHNISGWASHGLRVELADDPAFREATEFYVRLRMKAEGYREIHRALSGIVKSIRIEAVIGSELPGASAADRGLVDLAVIRRQVRAYVDSLQVPGKPYGCYRDTKDAPPSLYASCDVAILRTVMGEDLRTSLTLQQRREWIEQINSFASPEGTYLGGRHSLEHANGMVVGALGPLGGKQKYPVRLYDGLDTVEKVGPWLEKIDWRKQWSGSHLFWGGMHCFSCSSRCSPAWRAAVFAWLDANLDPTTGWWRRGVPQARPGIDGLGGGAHIWPIYQHHGHRFPYPERAIDSILALQKADGCWLRYANYLDLDALYGLAYMKSLAPSYRNDDIAVAVARHGHGLRTAFAEFLRRDPDAHNLLAAVGAFGLLNQLLPQTYVDSARWTDIFSDPRLYQTRAVEVLPTGESPR